MGKKENLLRTILGGVKGNRYKLTFQEVNDSQFGSETVRIYIQLGGMLEKFPTGFGNFDIQVDRTYIELDEQLHFNKYRLITLNSKIYDNCKFFSVSKYKQLCEEHQINCLKAGGYGGKWKNDSTEKQFSKSSDYKDISGNGPSRWRQRAFYDLLKDVSATIHNLPFLRISIWETIILDLGESTIKEILDKEKSQFYEELERYIKTKIS